MGTFQQEMEQNIAGLKADSDFQRKCLDWIEHSVRHRYSYNFRWLGRPIIQYPQDIVAVQEIIWSVKPDLIIETGIAHGGSLILSASILELIGGDGIVVGIDIDIRKYNREKIESHPLYRRIRLIEGSSADKKTMRQVKELISSENTVMVFLDSNHTHDHVLQELDLYSPLVTPGSYLVVFDTIVEDMPEEMWHGRPWSKGNNPKTAVREFLKSHPNFQIDDGLEAKLGITVAPSGYLVRVS